MLSSSAAESSSDWKNYLQDISQVVQEDVLKKEVVIETKVPEQLVLDLGIGEGWQTPDKFGFSTWLNETLRSPVSMPRSIARRKAHSFSAYVKSNRNEKSPSSQFVALQEWEGYVEDISEEEGTFTARLTDKTQPDDSFEIAEFDLSDVGSDDLELVRVGGIFRWVLGYRTFSAGRTEKSSSLIFRRLPAWRKVALARNVEEARELAKSIRWE